MDYSFKPSNSR